MKPFMDLSDDTFLQMYSLDRSVPLAYRIHKLADYTWRVERDAMGEDHLLLSLVSRTSRLEEVLLNGEPAMKVFEAAPLLDGQDRSVTSKNSKRTSARRPRWICRSCSSRETVLRSTMASSSSPTREIHLRSPRRHRGRSLRAGIWTCGESESLKIKAVARSLCRGVNLACVSILVLGICRFINSALSGVQTQNLHLFEHASICIHVLIGSYDSIGVETALLTPST